MTGANLVTICSRKNLVASSNDVPGNAKGDGRNQTSQFRWRIFEPMCYQILRRYRLAGVTAQGGNTNDVVKSTVNLVLSFRRTQVKRSQGVFRQRDIVVDSGDFKNCFDSPHEGANLLEIDNLVQLVDANQHWKPLFRSVTECSLPEAVDHGRDKRSVISDQRHYARPIIRRSVVVSPTVEEDPRDQGQDRHGDGKKKIAT